PCSMTCITMEQASMWGSQSTPSSVVTALCHTALHFGKCTLALHAHRHSSRIHQPYFSHPEHPTHTSASPNHGVLHTVLHPTMGSLTRGQHSWGSLTQCSRVRLRRPHSRASHF